MVLSVAKLMLNNGLKIQRACWPTNQFLHKDTANNTIIQKADGGSDIFESPDINFSMFTQEDIESNDWNQA